MKQKRRDERTELEEEVGEMRRIEVEVWCFCFEKNENLLVLPDTSLVGRVKKHKVASRKPFDQELCFVFGSTRVDGFLSI
jgi:hypothetical protein